MQALFPLERLDDALVTDVLPFLGRWGGYGEQGLDLVDEDATVEPKAGCTWNSSS